MSAWNDCFLTWQWVSRTLNLYSCCRAGIARRIVPFCGVAAADVLNIGITRRDEFLEGIKVFDDNGDEIGQSRQAGARAVSACIAGRIFAAAPVLVVPPLVMHRLFIEAPPCINSCSRAFMPSPSFVQSRPEIDLFASWQVGADGLLF